MAGFVSKRRRFDLWIWGKLYVNKVQCKILEIIGNIAGNDMDLVLTQLLESFPDYDERFLRACIRTHPKLILKEDGKIAMKGKHRKYR